MQLPLRRFALLAVALLLVVSTAMRHQTAETTTVILVRHAEKAAAPADDPPLTPDGTARAASLVGTLRDAGISAVYSTRWKRTQETATPIATALGVPITTFDGNPAAYAAEILAKHRGKVVLVVGHSNTLPPILSALGIRGAPPIADAEYANLFIVSVPPSGEARYIRAEYGAR